VLVDPGVSLGPRFRLIPHPREYQSLEKCRRKIAQYADDADIVTISHYHHDHCTPTYTDYVWNYSDREVARHIYQEKMVLAKDYRTNINASQRRRGWMLKKAIQDHVRDFVVADEQIFVFGDTSLQFSSPVPHGEANTPLGWVLMLTVEHNHFRFIHTSDVQGPISDETLAILLAQRPNLVYVGGPPLYLLNYRITNENLDRAMKNLTKLIEMVPTVILDHHLLRDETWRDASKMVFQTAQKRHHKVVTAAEFLNESDGSLEARRRTLYQNEPPAEAFNQWKTLPWRKRQRVKPPL
jgi:predicted metallo-beta-lactamase superfamily hydrolase